jgi:hypothetical protein
MNRVAIYLYENFRNRPKVQDSQHSISSSDINADLYSIIVLGTVILSVVLPALMGMEGGAMRKRSHRT